MSNSTHHSLTLIWGLKNFCVPIYLKNSWVVDCYKEFFWNFSRKRITRWKTAQIYLASMKIIYVSYNKHSLIAPTKGKYMQKIRENVILFGYSHNFDWHTYLIRVMWLPQHKECNPTLFIQQRVIGFTLIDQNSIHHISYDSLTNSKCGLETSRRVLWRIFEFSKWTRSPIQPDLKHKSIPFRYHKQ